jgi:hypothetical protein
LDVVRVRSRRAISCARAWIGAVAAQENLDRIDELSLVVAGCAVFIFILSEGCLESPFCRQERAAAVAAHVPVVLVTKEGARWPDAYGAMSDAFPSARLIDEAFTGVEEPCRSVFKSKAIQHSNEYFSAFSATVIKRVQSAVADSANEYPKGASAQALAQRRRLLAQRFNPQPPAPCAPVVVPRNPPSEAALPASPSAPPVSDGTPIHRAPYELSNQLSMHAAADTSPGFTRLVPYDAQDGAIVSVLTTMSRQSHDLAREQGGQLLGAFAQQSKHIGQMAEQHASHLASHLASQAAAHTSQIDMLLKLQAETHSRQMVMQAETHAKQMEAQSKHIALLTEQLGAQAKAHSKLTVDALDRQHATLEMQSAHMTGIIATHSRALLSVAGLHSAGTPEALGSPLSRGTPTLGSVGQRPAAYKRFSNLRPMFPGSANEDSGGDM